jgi:hypothetical protein
MRARGGLIGGRVSKINELGCEVQQRISGPMWWCPSEGCQVVVDESLWEGDKSGKEVRWYLEDLFCGGAGFGVR